VIFSSVLNQKGQVNELIDRANAEWDELHPGEPPEDRLLPLIRLRVRATHLMSRT
jgi:double-strand break repair protein MRE11